MVSAIVGFGRFWYRFIVGDDWTMAATVIVALAVTYALARAGIGAWWLVPVAAIAILGVSLRRARSAR